MPFSITPLSDIPPPNAEEFPQFIQFQSAGTDLGLPDADTLNFSTGMTATRGVGENSNVVTVTADGGSGGSSVGVIELTSVTDPCGVFGGEPFPETWNASISVPNENWEFDSETKLLMFLQTGVYRVIATCVITGRGAEGFEWPTGEVNYGSYLGEAKSSQYKNRQEDIETRVRWTDQAVIHVATAEETAVIDFYALSIDNAGWDVGECGMSLVIERLGDIEA